MVANIWGDHIADGQISACNRRTGNDTQTANGKKKYFVYERPDDDSTRQSKHVA
jgi:hypothetical protein